VVCVIDKKRIISAHLLFRTPTLSNFLRLPLSGVSSIRFDTMGNADKLDRRDTTDLDVSETLHWSVRYM
jgi:hypothetical protein